MKTLKTRLLWLGTHYATYAVLVGLAVPFAFHIGLNMPEPSFMLIAALAAYFIGNNALMFIFGFRTMDTKRWDEVCQLGVEVVQVNIQFPGSNPGILDDWPMPKHQRYRYWSKRFAFSSDEKKGFSIVPARLKRSGVWYDCSLIFKEPEKLGKHKPPALRLVVNNTSTL